MHGVALAIVGVAVFWLLGGLHGHHRGRRAGLSPRLYWSLGRGWYGSIRIGGFRIGHKLLDPPPGPPGGIRNKRR